MTNITFYGYAKFEDGTVISENANMAALQETWSMNNKVVSISSNGTDDDDANWFFPEVDTDVTTVDDANKLLAANCQ